MKWQLWLCRGGRLLSKNTSSWGKRTHHCLRDFQVSCIPAHLRPEEKTLVRCLILGWRSGFCRLWHWGRPYPVPTGYGKTMGPLITSLLLLPGKAINKIWIFEAPLYNLIIPRPPSNKSWMNQPLFPSFTSGSTTVLVVPLTSIAEEVKQECIRLGIRAVVGSQVMKLLLFLSKASPSPWHYHYYDLCSLSLESLWPNYRNSRS